MADSIDIDDADRLERASSNEEEAPSGPEVRLIVTLSDGTSQEIGMGYHCDFNALRAASVWIDYQGEGISPVFDFITPDALKSRVGE